MKFERHNWSSN